MGLCHIQVHYFTHAPNADDDNGASQGDGAHHQGAHWPAWHPQNNACATDARAADGCTHTMANGLADTSANEVSVAVPNASTHARSCRQAGVPTGQVRAHAAHGRAPYGAQRHPQVAASRPSLSWRAVRLLRRWLCSSEHGGRLGRSRERGCPLFGGYLALHH